MFVAISLVFGVIALIYVYLSWHRNYWKERGVPGPKKNLISGSFPKSLMQKVNIIDEVDEIYKNYRGTTPYVGIFSSRTPQILMLEPDYIRNVLVKDFKSFHDNEFGDLIDKKTDPIFSRNPFMLSGEEWKEKRAEITPAFTASKLKAMYPIIDDVCKKMKVFIAKQVENTPIVCFDAKELAAKYTTDVVSSCIYGVDSKAFTDEKSIIRQMGTTLFLPSMPLYIYFIVASIFPFITNIYQMPFVPKKTEHFFTNLMKDAIQMRKEQNIIRDDYLNYLLELRKKKNTSDLDMAAHTITFFLDGFETSSIVISHTLFLLGKYPEVQEKLRAEINETIKEQGSINFDNINEMPYLDQVMNETLRLYPPVGVITKKCTNAIELSDFKDKKVKIEKDLIAMIPIYSVQHDPEYYPDPDKFIPERFSMENGGLKKYKDLGVFLPFGDGPRQCLGIRFGLAQSKAAVVAVVRDFSIAVSSKTKEPYVIDPKQFLTLPVGGLWIDVKKL